MRAPADSARALPAITRSARAGRLGIRRVQRKLDVAERQLPAGLQVRGLDEPRVILAEPVERARQRLVGLGWDLLHAGEPGGEPFQEYGVASDVRRRCLVCAHHAECDEPQGSFGCDRQGHRPSSLPIPNCNSELWMPARGIVCLQTGAALRRSRALVFPVSPNLYARRAGSSAAHLAVADIAAVRWVPTRLEEP